MIKRLLLMTWILCGAALASPALHADDMLEVIIHAPYVELHTGPGRGYPIFHVAEKGETIHIEKRRLGQDWYKVITDQGVEGWVFHRELKNTLSPDGESLDFSAPGWLDFIDRQWELGFQLGSFEGTNDLSLYLGYHWTQNLATELKYTQAFGSFSDSKYYGISMVSLPFPEWRVSPFFLLGAGVLQISPSATLVQPEDREDNALTVGGGFYYFASRRLILRVEYNQHTTLSSQATNQEVEEWKAGISLFF